MDILVSVGLPLGLAFIMFSLGLGLHLADFSRVLTRPAAFLTGALCQILLIPVVAVAVIALFGITGAFAVGIVILAACPGGVTSNMISKFAKADVALSVSLTAVISLISILTVPLLIAFAYARYMPEAGREIDITGTAITMFALTAVPIALAMIARKVLPGPMTRFEPVASTIATVLFAVIIIAAIATNLDLVTQNMALFGPAMVLMLAVMMTLGFVIPRLLGRSPMEAKTISIEAGVQNGSLGIVIAGLIAGERTGFPPEAIPSAIYGILMYLSLIPALLWFRRMT